MTAEPLDESEHRRRRRAIALGLFVAAVIALTVGGAVAQYTAGGVSNIDIERFIESWGSVSAAASVLLMVLHALVPFPAELVAVANGMLFGVLWGTVITWVGAMLGAILSFGLSRRYGQPLLRDLIAESRWAATRDWIGRRGVLALLGARLLPVVSFNLINMAAGFAGVGWWRFLWTTGVGILPMTLAMVLLGAGVLQSPSWTLAAGIVVIAVMVGAVMWRRRRLSPPAVSIVKLSSSKNKSAGQPE